MRIETRTQQLFTIVSPLVARPRRRSTAAGCDTRACTARALAPIDLTGNWCRSSLKTAFRMDGRQGNYASVPLNGAARAWPTLDPAKDTAAGNACKSYGAAGIMRVPGRLHISADDTTRRLRPMRALRRACCTSPARRGDPSWQGYSAAVWENGWRRRWRRARRAAPPAPAGGTVAPAEGRLPLPLRAGTRRPRRCAPPRGGSLKGQRRVQGRVPAQERRAYSDNAAHRVLRSHTESNGDEWFTVTTMRRREVSAAVSSPRTHFKREADASKWYPSACKAS